MKDLSKRTTLDLINEFDRLDVALEMEMLMDGSGELGGEIHKLYFDEMRAIEKELEKRGLWNRDDFSEKGDFEYDDDLPF